MFLFCFRIKFSNYLNKCSNCYKLYIFNVFYCSWMDGETLNRHGYVCLVQIDIVIILKCKVILYHMYFKRCNNCENCKTNNYFRRKIWTHESTYILILTLKNNAGCVCDWYLNISMVSVFRLSIHGNSLNIIQQMS